MGRRLGLSVRESEQNVDERGDHQRIEEARVYC